MSFADQSGFAVRFEWGLPGLRATSADAIVVIVDVLSFTTSVSVACRRGAVVFPCPWGDERASELARRENAELGARRGSEAEGLQRFSLSPESLLAASPGLRLVLPSQNGSVLAHEAVLEDRSVIAASIRNAASVAGWLSRQDSPIAVVAAGERWEDGTWRFSVEDLVGAGAVISRLHGRCSPEAESASAAFRHVQFDLLMTLRNCSSGRQLVKRGFDADVALAAQSNADDTVPIIVERAFRSA